MGAPILSWIWAHARGHCVGTSAGNDNDLPCAARFADAFLVRCATDARQLTGLQGMACASSALVAEANILVDVTRLTPAGSDALPVHAREPFSVTCIADILCG
eukprot:764282-Amphidinium_carterae.1